MIEKLKFKGPYTFESLDGKETIETEPVPPTAEDMINKINELVDAVNNSNRYGYPEYLPKPNECTKCGDIVEINYYGSVPRLEHLAICHKCRIVYRIIDGRMER